MKLRKLKVEVNQNLLTELGENVVENRKSYERANRLKLLTLWGEHTRIFGNYSYTLFVEDCMITRVIGFELN